MLRMFGNFYWAAGLESDPPSRSIRKKSKEQLRFSISRPADLTAFGAEWVQLFPKDSWENVTNEYEPFTFNMYGAKIPLPGFRSTPTGIDPDHPDAPVDTDLEAIDGTGLSLQSADGTETEIGASPSGVTGTSAPEATTGYVNVYMEVSDDGDYEVRSHLIPCVHLSAYIK